LKRRVTVLFIFGSGISGWCDSGSGCQGWGCGVMMCLSLFAVINFLLCKPLKDFD
jgi:hypothetical protein